MKRKKVLSALLCLVLALSLLPAAAFAADLGGTLDFDVTTGVTYDSATKTYTVSAAGDYSVTNKSGTATSADRIVVTAATGTVTLKLSGINIERNGAAIVCDGACTTRLLLPDGATNTIKNTAILSAAIWNKTNPLVIAGETRGTGVLNVETTGNYSSAIGAPDCDYNNPVLTTGNTASNIRIEGGTVNAYAKGARGAAIGGFTVDGITISGGTVTATAAGGAGIGSTGDADNRDSVYSTAKNITISGGTVTAQGGAGSAGIGGGLASMSVENITITGGDVTATGGSYGGNHGGAGIGGGGRYVPANAGMGNVDGVTISSGTVRAYGGRNAAGIGGGTRGNCYNVTISGGTVTAFGGGDDDLRTDPGGAGIGGGLLTSDYQWGEDATDSGYCQNVTISGGTVTASGYHGIGAGKTENLGSPTKAENIKISPAAGKSISVKTGENYTGAGAADMDGAPFTTSTDVTAAVQLKASAPQQYFHSEVTTPGVNIAGMRIGPALPYYVNAASGTMGSVSAAEPASGWNAYLEEAGGVYTLHLKDFTLTTDMPEAVQITGISKLYIELEGTNTVTTTSSDDTSIGISAPSTDLVLYNSGSLAVAAQAGVAISARSIALQYPATLIAEGYTQATSARVSYDTGAYDPPKDERGDWIIYYFSDTSLYLSTPFVRFTPKTDAAFPVWVAGVRVTSANRNDVLGSADAGATVTYAPAHGSTPATLTLNGASISGYKNIGSSDVAAGIYAEDEPLALHLIGKNTVSIQAALQTLCGVTSIMALTVTAEPGAVLETDIENSANPNIDPAAFAVYSEAVVKLSDCEIIEPPAAAIVDDGKRIDDNDEDKADCLVNIGRAASITYDLAGGSVRNANPTGYFINSTDITLENPTKPGYTFAGWTGTGLSAATVDVTIPTGSTGERSYTATWTANAPADTTAYYRLSFETNGGSEIDALTRSGFSTVDLSAYVPTREGYTFTGWYADAALTEAVASVRMTKNASVYAGWKWNNPFSDVAEADWFCGDVEYVYQNGLFEGVTATAFAPETPMTRAMLVTVLWRMEKAPVLADYDSGFRDLTADWYIDAVNWAQQQKLVNGYDAARFGPDDPVTREQLVAILYRYAVSKGYDVSVGEDTNILSYLDAFDIAEYAIPAFQWACGAGICAGDSGSLRPGAGASRAETAAILHRFCAAYAD